MITYINGSAQGYSSSSASAFGVTAVLHSYILIL